MYSESAWEAQTKELITRIEHEVQEIEAETARRIAVFNRKKEALEESLVTYREMMYIEDKPASEILSPDDIRDKSQKDILCMIASRNNGLLVANQAVKLMKDAGVFGNPENASSAIYSVLKRSTKEFTRVGQGVYKLRDWSNTPDNSPVKNELKKVSLPDKQAFVEEEIDEDAEPETEQIEEDLSEATGELKTEDSDIEKKGNTDEATSVTDKEKDVVLTATNESQPVQSQPEEAEENTGTPGVIIAPDAGKNNPITDASSEANKPVETIGKQTAQPKTGQPNDSWIQQLEQEAIKLIPLVLARKYNAIPISVTGNTLIVAMANPYDIFAIEAFSARSHKHITPVAANSDEIKQAIDFNYKD